MASDGDSHVDRLCEDWLVLAAECGLVVEDEHGNLLPDVLDAILRTITQAIWFGLTTGCLTLSGSYTIPHRLQAWTRACVRDRQPGPGTQAA